MTGTDTFSNADLVAVIEEYWAPMGLEEFFAKTVAADFFTDLSEFQSEGNDIYHVPDVYTNQFTVQTQSTQGTEVTLGSPAQNDVTLTVANHVYIAYILGDLAKAQISKSYNVSEMYAKKAGSTLENDLESDLFALWSGLSTNVVGDTATVVSDAEIRQSMNALDTRNIPIDEVAWFFHPYVYWNQILAVQKYYDQSQFAKAGSRGGGGAAMMGTLSGAPLSENRAMRGMLYGAPLFSTTNVVSGLRTYRNLLAHRTAFGFAVQTPNGGVRTRAANWLANLGVLTVHDLIDGVAELRDEAAVVVNASNAFLGS